MDAAELDYDLPASAIAQHPVEPRDAARLLVDQGPGRAPEHRTVAALADLLDPADVLVVNDTRVIPARLHLRKATGGAVEVLLLERRPEGWWEALVKPSRRVAPGSVLVPAADGPSGDVRVEVGEVLGADGRRRVTVHGGTDDDLAVLAQVGEVPLPPYIHEPLADPERYQTVFARHPGSVAAPTAGLHLTDAVLDRCRARGITVVAVELVVGLGTFRPITADRVEDHPMHAERYRIPAATRQVLQADRAGGRVVAVGTTVVRALESWAETGADEGDTRLFIHGDRPFAVVDRLLTNFHVPRSSLLALVQALVGPRWRDLYAEALAEGYRFLSFGDAMLLRPDPAGPPA
ncbi:tRNA preQ1(34) S-adenosylmethionine ribosyltransferase-isomerase QueA [Aquihabitans sp. G128]|uniref:tRNA preQ1(34) S-adenosylmethionine ribosyltransferase-isomerase QueA n=1 Tax=Aquihabitans sp. G128 TaxID=2849779 RepID=UPI001C24F7A7|nr:tRNA preQ1(34) S-adenosylmethionine ribosyltransferase-isomerase QueA [Aquihabitans sp. G128]QXC61842.1 tRNA preQ1(34) S-adenosylmethionine ribosyltransferase-isomerase QueA [Aquihabitans sp. G128]